MSISKEIRIGLLVSISILVLFVGFYFLKGTNLLIHQKQYYCYFNNVQGLQTSSTVQIKGMDIGRVVAVQLDDAHGIKVSFTVGKNIKLPNGTIAKLMSSDILTGAKVIVLELGNRPGYIKDGDSLPTEFALGILDNMSNEINPLIQDVRTVVGTLDSVAVSIKDVLGPSNKVALSHSLNSIDVATSNIAQLSKTLNTEITELHTILINAKSITGNLAQKNDTINAILNNTASATRQLANSDLQSTLETLHATALDLKEILDKVNGNKGSMGALVNDREAYDNLNTSLKSLNDLITDLKQHPGRYVNISVFGKHSK